MARFSVFPCNVLQLGQRNILVLLFAGLALPVSAQQQAISVHLDSLGGSVYSLEVLSGESRLGAAMVASIGPDGVFLVDDLFAHPALSGLIERTVTGTGDGKPVRWVFNTHWHPDHNGGNAYFNESATILSHENVRKRLAEGTTATGLSQPGVEATFPARDPEDLPDETFSESMTLPFNGEIIQIRHFPNSHTDGDGVVYFPESRVAAVGDLVWPGQFPSVDMDNGGSVVGLARSIHTMLDEWPDDVRIVSGHGPIGSMADLQAYADMLDASLHAVQAGIDSGTSLEALRAEGLGNKWVNWAHPLVPEAVWIGFVHESLTQASMESENRG